MIKPTCFIDPLDMPLGRRGSYLCFANANDGESQFGKSTLYLSTCRGGGSGMANLGTPNSCRAIRIELTKGGVPLPAVISTSPGEAILESEYGGARFCLAERKLVLCRAGDGLGLSLTLPPAFLLEPIQLPGGAWRFPFAEGTGLLQALRGDLIRSPGGFFVAPDHNGEILLAVEECGPDPEPRSAEAYPDYDAAVSELMSEFETFCQAVCPRLPEEFEPRRRQALYTTWSMMVDPEPGVLYPRTMVKMMRFIFESAFSWQQAMQAICLSKAPRLAWDVLMSCFDLQDETGRIADAVSHRSYLVASMKPPFQGAALRWLLKNADLRGISREEKHALYLCMGRWTDYLFRFRDLDGDGLWENLSPLETGWEDASYFSAGFPLASPDANAYTVVMMDALAELGRSIGESEEECRTWSARADELTEQIIRKFWTGDRWVAVNTVTGTLGETPSLPLYATLILGKRLPRDIRDKTISFIMGEGGFSTPYGFASENLHSPYFRHGFTAGSVIVPAQMILCLALEEAGRPELAREMGLKYARTLRDNGMFHIHNALDGRGERSLVAFGERQLFWSSWASSAYLFLADRYGNRE
ncbi:MAG: hypothetical protein IKN89_08305 [Oscillospiraceae bacterium]|nr:hypothetical protein [Oscillospiraceae bacterium]